jgi:carboxymethylenebutenolidase
MHTVSARQPFDCSRSINTSKKLKELGKTYIFHRYDGAGHGFFYYHMPLYRQQAAMDGWNKVDEFFGQYLA